MLNSFFHNNNNNGFTAVRNVLNHDASNTVSYPGSGTKWYDLSGNQYTNTLTNGPTFSAGSIVFDGLNDFSTTGDITETSGPLSVFCWVRPTDLTLGSSGGIFFNWLLNKRGNTTDLQWQLYFRNSYLRASIFSAANTSIGSIDTTTLFSENVWYYVGFTSAGVNGSGLNIYTNGISDASEVTLSGDMNTGARPIVMAKAAWDNRFYYKGFITDVKIWDRVLSPEEVYTNYQSSKYRFGL